MRRLETPPTLRTPGLDEIPATPEYIEAIEKSKSAKIVEGFTFKYNESHDLPFRFYAEINIDNSRLWNFFKTLALHLPDEICLIFNHADADANFGDYWNKFTLLNAIEKFETELTQDCFMEFGVIHQTDDLLEETFVDCTKFVKYWGSDEAWFRSTMKDFDLFEIPDLNFMDEFPKVREALNRHKSDVMDTMDLVEELKVLFEYPIEQSQCTTLGNQ